MCRRAFGTELPAFLIISALRTSLEGPRYSYHSTLMSLQDCHFRIISPIPGCLCCFCIFLLSFAPITFIGLEHSRKSSIAKKSCKLLGDKYAILPALISRVSSKKPGAVKKCEPNDAAETIRICLILFVPVMR